MTEEQRRAVEYEEEEKERAAKTDFHKSQTELLKAR